MNSISQLEVMNKLGTGTFGKVKMVYLKNEKSRGEYYALKIMKKSVIRKHKQQDHVKSEKKILMNVNFPFIVKCYSTFQDKEQIYILMEFISGGELFSKLRKEGRFSHHIVLFYSSEILISLIYLHQNKIIYRDLKPENLLIDSTGHIKITDFGFAKYFEAKTYTLCGTPEYLSPEIIKGHKKGYGYSVDIWSFGILLFEMLAGYPPFYDSKPIGIYKKIMSGIIEFPGHLNTIQKDLIRKLLNPKPKYRIGVDDVNEIKNHKFFRCVNFTKVRNLHLPVPWVPFQNQKIDARYFEKLSSTENNSSIGIDPKSVFKDF